MRSVELAGAIGLVFGEPQRQVLRGQLRRSIEIGLAPENESGRNRWRPNGHTTASQRGLAGLLGSPLDKELLKARDKHSRSRHGNQRP